VKSLAYLLEEHETCADERPTPASTFEQVNPAYNLKLDSVADCPLLQMRVSLGTDFSMERDFGADVEPFALDPMVCRR